MIKPCLTHRQIEMSEGCNPHEGYYLTTAFVSRVTLYRMLSKVHRNITTPNTNKFAFGC